MLEMGIYAVIRAFLMFILAGSLDALYR